MRNAIELCEVREIEISRSIELPNVTNILRTKLSERVKFSSRS